MKNNKIDKSFFHCLFLIFIILLLPIFLFKEYRIIVAKKDIRILPAEEVFQSKLHENNNKSFTFIILTKNMINMIDENFQSILKQQYEQYQVIYIDQGSIDGTPERISELIKEEKQFTLIKTKKDHEAFRAYFNAIDALENGEIVIHLSGRDFLAHNEVLNRLDRAYTNPDIWLTYGQYLDYHSYRKGIYNPKPQKTLYKKRVQKAPWLLAPLKTFYAGHFKEIKRGRSIEGYFLSIKNEISLLSPLVEMGKAHVQFIPDILYIHSQASSEKKKRMKLSFMLEKYKKSIHQVLPKEQERVEMLLFSNDSPNQLSACLSSIENYIPGIGKISVICQCDEETFLSYQKIKERYPEICLIRSDQRETLDFKRVFFLSLVRKENRSPYIILSSDQVIVGEEIPLFPCIAAMRQTRADAFYFYLGKKGDQKDSNGIYSWVVKRREDIWGESDILKMALYRKIDLERDFKYASFSSVADLIELFAKQESNHHFGLSFERSKIL